MNRAHFLLWERVCGEAGRAAPLFRVSLARVREGERAGSPRRARGPDPCRLVPPSHGRRSAEREQQIMSWQQYVDANLVGTGQVTQAGIYDLQGNPWAYTQSPPFAAQVAEVAAVSAHFAAPAGLAATGAVIAGVKYMFVRGEENAEIYVKKGNEGVYFYRCNTCIIVAYHNDKIQPGTCSACTAKLGDFLKEQGI